MGLKEPFNSISHMVGAGLAIAAFPFLVLRAHGPLQVVSATVYGTTLLAVFTMSAIYHGVTHAKASAWLFRLDQAMIYLLIAGTYTPMALVLLGDATGWALFGIEWGLAAAGVTLLLTVHRTPQWIHQAAYIVLGWAAVVALPRLGSIPWPGLALIFGGGVAYTGGAFLYGRNRPRTFGIGDHGVWHLLVIAGAAAHMVFVQLFVLG